MSSLFGDRMPVFVGVLAYKGGTGKTTISSVIGAGLSLLKGRRVLLIDLDPQANLTSVFISSRMFEYVEKTARMENTVFSLEAFLFPHTKPLIVPVPGTENLYIMPSHPKYMRAIELLGGVSVDRALAARTLLGDLVEKFNLDYIVVDFPPQMYQYVTTIAVASVDYILTPVAKGAFNDIAARYMIETFYETARTLRKGENMAVFLGAVLTRFQRRETSVIREIKERLRRHISTVARKVDAPVVGDPVFGTVLYYNPILTKISSNVIARTPYLVKVLTGSYRGKWHAEYRAMLKENINSLVTELETRVKEVISGA